MPTPNADLDFWRGIVRDYPHFAERALGAVVKPEEIEYRHVRRLEATVARISVAEVMDDE